MVLVFLFYSRPTGCNSVREKFPYTEFFLVRIFLCSVRIQENTDQKKLRIWTLFTFHEVTPDNFFYILHHHQKLSDLNLNILANYLSRIVSVFLNFYNHFIFKVVRKRFLTTELGAIPLRH